jgi:hypothetical protein
LLQSLAVVHGLRLDRKLIATYMGKFCAAVDVHVSHASDDLNCSSSGHFRLLVGCKSQVPKIQIRKLDCKRLQPGWL